MNEEKGTSLSIINEDIMMERGKFEANGYTFTVYPVRLKEEEAFYADTSMLSPIPKKIANGDTITDEELAMYVIALFSKTANYGTDDQPKEIGKFRKFIIRFFYHNDYHYYEDRPRIMPFVKWVEQKVKFNGKKVKFFDLERKFSLSKAEIGRLFIYFYQLTGF